MNEAKLRNEIMHSFPSCFLGIGVVIGGLFLFLWAAGAAFGGWETLSLAHAGCLMTLDAAMCEWRVIDWRMNVETSGEQMAPGGFARRQAMSVHRQQLWSVSRLVHILFGVGTLCWGFGDLLTG